MVKTAVSAINAMLEEINSAFVKLGETIGSFVKADYATTIEIGHYGGEVGGLFASFKALGESVSDMMAIIAKNGHTLHNGAITLSQASDRLNMASNEQAGSLEETAASIEELTSNISSNSQKAIQMANIAKEVQISANEGKKLADNTVTAMNEINKATNAINEAVTVIDNIAFQTNILSLNAAVEAATAGDAGKGFAVVAQEVRNLANRSAEAAKEIKNLAALANTKSSEGLTISNDMIEGFSVLNQKITHTAELVSQSRYAG